MKLMSNSIQKMLLAWGPAPLAALPSGRRCLPSTMRIASVPSLLFTLGLPKAHVQA